MEYQVIDTRTDQINPLVRVDAASPEEAVSLALGVQAFRSGRRHDLVARVYWSTPGNRNMIRLYSSAIEKRIL